MSPSVYQAGHELMRETLRDALLAAVDSEGGGGLGSAQCRASAALYVLLGDHAIDRRGRCRSCRRPNALVGRRRRICRVYLAARFYLYQPDRVLLRHLAGVLDEDVTPRCLRAPACRLLICRAPVRRPRVRNVFMRQWREPGRGPELVDTLWICQWC